MSSVLESALAPLPDGLDDWLEPHEAQSSVQNTVAHNDGRTATVIAALSAVRRVTFDSRVLGEWMLTG
jgi:hypothetical protein